MLVIAMQLANQVVLLAAPPGFDAVEDQLGLVGLR